jgi:uncharacterized protein (TIGR02444 family)
MTQDGNLPDPATALWDFAVSVYGRPGVAEGCVSLQDSYGADVPLILFCLWLPDGRFPPLRGKALKVSRRWQSGVVAPLRSSRRALKDLIKTGDAATVRLHEQVKALELEAERLQLCALALLVSDYTPWQTSAPAHVTAARNLDAYFSGAQIQLDPLGKTIVLRILGAAFGT